MRPVLLVVSLIVVARLLGALVGWSDTEIFRTEVLGLFTITIAEIRDVGGRR